jgi:hypothetical protein
MMTMVKYDSEAWVLKKAVEDFLDIARCLPNETIVLCTRLVFQTIDYTKMGFNHAF